VDEFGGAALEGCDEVGGRWESVFRVIWVVWDLEGVEGVEVFIGLDGYWGVVEAVEVGG